MEMLLAALVALVFLQGPAEPESLKLVPAIIEAVEEISCEGRQFGQGCGTLLVDVGSFTTVINRIEGVSVREAQVRAAVPRPFRDVPARTAHACDVSEYPCGILHSGTHVQLESLTSSGQTWSAVVTFSWMRPGRKDRSHFGFHKVELYLAYEDGRWVTKSGTLLMAT